MINSQVEQLYNTHGHYVYERCRGMLGDPDEAYDALQEVFIKLIKARPSIDGDRPILAWINRVTTNHCLNRLRARRYRTHVPLDQRWDLKDITPMAFLHGLSERRDTIRRLLAAVDERTQRVVVSYFFDEDPVEAIGEGLGISVPTVRRTLKKFLSGARRKLEAESERLVDSEVMP